MITEEELQENLSEYNVEVIPTDVNSFGRTRLKVNLDWVERAVIGEPSFVIEYDAFMIWNVEMLKSLISETIEKKREEIK